MLVFVIIQYYVLIKYEQFVIDCNFNNGMCGQHECQEYVIGSRNISECVCKEGFQSANIYDDCKGNFVLLKSYWRI